MAYTMTHILIAEELQHEFKRELDYSTYILGTIAPDAVHAQSDFRVEQKERSHLFAKGLRWGQIRDEKDSQIWLESIKNYYLNNRHKYNIDFLLGYIVHLLADVYCSLHFYAPFVNGIDGNYEEKMAQFKRENYCVNYYFFENFSKEKNLDDILRKGQPITLEGIISKAVIERRIEQLLEFEFKRWDISHIEEQKICKIEDMECLIQGASLFIKKIFIDDYYLFGR